MQNKLSIDEMSKYWKKAKWSDVSDNIEQHYISKIMPKKYKMSIYFLKNL